MIPNAPIREAVEEALKKGHFETLGEIARELGWRKSKLGEYDTSRLKRALGLQPEPTQIKNGKRYGGNLRTAMKEKTAIEIIRALDRMPVEFDL